MIVQQQSLPNGRVRSSFLKTLRGKVVSCSRGYSLVLVARPVCKGAGLRCKSLGRYRKGVGSFVASVGGEARLGVGDSVSWPVGV